MTRRTATLSLLAPILLLVGGCQIGRPFRGPGFDPREGVTAATAGPTVVVAVTHAVSAPGRRRDFSRRTASVMGAIESQPGLIGWSVRKQIFGNEAWTLSVWTDESSLAAFVRSPAHLDAMRADTLADFTTVRIDVPREAIPIGWPRALEILEERR